MKLSLIFTLSGLASASLFPRGYSQCNRDNCLIEVEAQYAAKRDCSSYQIYTVTKTPATHTTYVIQTSIITVSNAAITSTEAVTSTSEVTAALLGSTLTITSTSKASTRSTTSQVSSTSTVTIFTTTITSTTTISSGTTTVLPTGAPNLNPIGKRDESRRLPPYATCCSHYPSQYSSACDCLGVPARTITKTSSKSTVTKTSYTTTTTTVQPAEITITSTTFLTTTAKSTLTSSTMITSTNTLLSTTQIVATVTTSTASTTTVTQTVPLSTTTCTSFALFGTFPTVQSNIITDTYVAVVPSTPQRKDVYTFTSTFDIAIVLSNGQSVYAPWMLFTGAPSSSPISILALGESGYDEKPLCRIDQVTTELSCVGGSNGNGFWLMQYTGMDGTRRSVFLGEPGGDGAVEGTITASCVS